MSLIYKVLLGLFVSAVIALSAQALELKAALADKDYPPFYFYDEVKQEYAGISIDICRAVAQSLGYDLTFVRMPFVRLLHDLSEGKADIACTLFNTSSRAPGITFTGVPHTFENISVFARNDRQAQAQKLDIENIKRYKIGGVRAYFYGKKFEDKGNFKKLEVNDEAQLIKVLLAKRIDYALGNKASILHQAREFGVADKLMFIEGSVYSGPIYIGFSRSRDDAHKLSAEFTKAIVRLRGSDEYQAILEHYQASTPLF
ncbi:transporter substrate-binding domain-containing protein [Gilvimarinus sp. SDUM040013]|uniref:Transporter substrate-binding domain-containing protein n=1 Tax=Gilvimarinus gilvus TaxID=3058038 RepID=A0ABU4RX77_9GAMM|nr:transporter substrate-binding domain-containing protein [Gilvimarinus sp. SDUM040013]MDO3386617.1 transporter substrate-binding domain-containing protein [Gilvimarinus sp. SDUM040013]MDX6849496.1 transporter substrate-binding domain-containing protein [Gilvimarinus sp. SDUM040013]